METQAWLCLLLSMSFKFGISCPDGCDCDAKTVYVHCNQLELDFIPPGPYGNNTRSLLIHHNNIVSITTELHALPNLLQLDISRNNISTILSDAFWTLNELAYLDLSFNNLNTDCLNGGQLLRLVNLERLILSSNRLTYFNTDWISTCNKLNLLDLSNNEIVSIDFTYLVKPIKLSNLLMGGNPFKNPPQNLSKTFTDLRLLDLSYTNTSNLSWIKMLDLPLVEVLDLSGNFISDIADEVFIKTSGLSKLILDNCGLTSVPKLALSTLTRLYSLSISASHITSLNANSFPPMPSLLVLVLKMSALLTTVNDGALSPLPSLVQLDLSHCSITTFSPTAMDNFNLYVLSLQGNSLATLNQNVVNVKTKLTIYDNPLICDCNLTWLHSQLSTDPDRGVLTDLVKCAGPPKFAHQPLLHVDKCIMCQQSCDLPYQQSHVWLIIFIPVTFVAILITCFLIYREKKCNGCLASIKKRWFSEGHGHSVVLFRNKYNPLATL